jgi:hypothetical protein
MYNVREYAEAGGLISYGTNLQEAFRQVGFWASDAIFTPQSAVVRSLPLPPKPPEKRVLTTSMAPATPSMAVTTLLIVYVSGREGRSRPRRNTNSPSIARICAGAIVMCAGLACK